MSSILSAFKVCLTSLWVSGFSISIRDRTTSPKKLRNVSLLTLFHGSKGPSVDVVSSRLMISFSQLNPIWVILSRLTNGLPG